MSRQTKNEIEEVRPYLQQMGDIPLFTETEELEAAQTVEAARLKFRRKLYESPFILEQLLSRYRAVQENSIAFRSVVQCMESEKSKEEHAPLFSRTRASIQRRLTPNLRTLTGITNAISDAVGDRRHHLREKITRLIEELSPRPDLLSELIEKHATAKEDPRYRTQLRALQKQYQDSLSALADPNQRLVIFIAKKFRGRDLGFADLIQEGNRGLMEAARRFDWRRGWAFATYATWWIEQSIERALAAHSRTPAHVYPILPKVRTILEYCKDKGIQDPSPEYILKLYPEKRNRNGHMRKPPAVSDIRTALKCLRRRNLSMDATTNNGDERNMHTFVGETPGEISDSADSALRKIAVERTLAKLRPSERDIIELRFGLTDGQPKTLEEIAQKRGVTRENIRQIEARALIRLRMPHIRRDLEGFVDVHTQDGEDAGFLSAAKAFSATKSSLRPTKRSSA